NLFTYQEEILNSKKIYGLKATLTNVRYGIVPDYSNGVNAVTTIYNKHKHIIYDYLNLDYRMLKNEQNLFLGLNQKITTSKNFSYNAQSLLSIETSTNFNNQTLETKYFYPHELITEPFMNDLKIANRIGTPIKTENWKNGIKLSEKKTTYAKDATTNNLLLPKNVYSATFPNTLPALPNGIGSLENKITYNQYDDKGNIQQFTPEKGASTTIIWGYNKTQPIAKIENATYTSIQSYEVNLQTLSNTGTEPNLIIALNTLRANLPNAMVTTYTHKPLVGVSTITDPKGNQITYTYDTFGRLQFVKDKDGNTLSENEYHYKN
ncbi:MAG: RHS repeat protein, partial [Ferruginibacter sp.]|nr:RHS repeat protein [Ferruginibacter sp.]